MALVITIVIIIILATVTINFTFGENGLITRAQQAKEQMEISSIKERMELAAGVAYIEGEGVIDLEYYFGLLEKEGILDRDYLVDNEDGTYEITTEEGYVFEITYDEANGGSITVENIGKENNIGPQIRKIKTSTTTNSISIEVETRDAEGGTYTYSYKKAGEENWIEAETSQNNTCTIGSLEAGATYIVQVKVETANGETTKEKEVIVGEMPGEGTITFGETQWQGDGTASIKIETSEIGYTLQYQKNGTEGSWTNITSGGTIENLSHGDTVYARLWDGTNESEHASVDITDDTAPEVSISTSNLEFNSVTLNVTAEDRQSGLAETGTYAYYLGNELKATNETNSYTFTELTYGTSYTLKVVVTDKAGKTTEKSTTITTPNIVSDVLKEGDYVNYIDGTGVTRTCVVLYGPENENYSSYGIQIITMETVEDVQIGNGTGSSSTNSNATYFEAARISYNEVINTLHTRAQEYLNTTYASAARNVGSVPNNPTYDGAGMYTREDSWFEAYNEKFKAADTNYLEDYNRMNKIVIQNIGKAYWLSSRDMYINDSGVGFRVLLIGSYGSLSYATLCGVNSSRSWFG